MTSVMTAQAEPSENRTFWDAHEVRHAKRVRMPPTTMLATRRYKIIELAFARYLTRRSEDFK